MTIAIVLYDGECQFCNKWIYFAKNRLQNNQISFIPFNSSKAINILEDYKLVNQDSVVYIKDDLVCFKSRAVLRICKQLKFPYYLFCTLNILPIFLLDLCYDFVANKRFKFTNKKKCCNG